MGTGQGTHFTDQQIRTLIILERTGGIVSLISVCLVFLAYGLFRQLRTVPNTFLVLASIANAGACMVSIISYSGIWAGSDSSLCQAQGFMFEL